MKIENGIRVNTATITLLVNICCARQKDRIHTSIFDALPHSCVQQPARSSIHVDLEGECGSTGSRCNTGVYYQWDIGVSTDGQMQTNSIESVSSTPMLRFLDRRTNIRRMRF